MWGCRGLSSLADSVACAVGVAASIHARILAFLAAVVAVAAAAAAAAAPAAAGAGAVIPTWAERGGGVATDAGLGMPCVACWRHGTVACWRYGTREAIEEFEFRGGVATDAASGSLHLRA